MPLRPLALCLTLLAAFAGCGQRTEPPLYVANFDQIKLGMPRLKVQEAPRRTQPRRLPQGRRPAAVRSQPNPLHRARELIRALGGTQAGGPPWSERWQYGRFGPGDIPALLSGSDEAFIVWFDRDAAVIAFRRPISGPFADTLQVSPPVSQTH